MPSEGPSIRLRDIGDARIEIANLPSEPQQQVIGFPPLLSGMAAVPTCRSCDRI